ncbi:hypothetical protein GCM10009743_19070 [Kribbella swartbergensis]
MRPNTTSGDSAPRQQQTSPAKQDHRNGDVPDVAERNVPAGHRAYDANRDPNVLRRSQEGATQHRRAVQHRSAKTRPSLSQEQRLAWIQEILTGIGESLPYHVAGMLLPLYQVTLRIMSFNSIRVSIR